MYCRNLFQQCFLTVFLLCSFRFFVIHNVYALRKYHCIAKICFRKIHLEETVSISEETGVKM